jgi:hypothetical protein
MSPKSDARLTAGERLSRGLKYSALGPVDVTRGALGLGVHSAQSSAAWVGERYRRGEVTSQLSKDLAGAQEVVANLPQALQDARPAQRRRRPLLFVGIGAVVLAAGAATFSIVRRSSRPEPSAASQSRPPSVEVEPRP